MGRPQFLVIAKKNLTETQFETVKNNLHKVNTTGIRYIVEDEYDIASKASSELMARGERDEVVESRMRDVQVMYNEYMETFEL